MRIFRVLMDSIGGDVRGVHWLDFCSHFLVGFATSWNWTKGILVWWTPQFTKSERHTTLNPDMFPFFGLQLLLCHPNLNHGSPSSCNVVVSKSFNHGVGHKGPERGAAFIIWGNPKGGGQKGKAKGKGNGQNDENPGALSGNDWRLWEFWSLKWSGADVRAFWWTSFHAF